MKNQFEKRISTLEGMMHASVTKTPNKDMVALKRQSELLLQLLDDQDREDRAKREHHLRMIWAIENGAYRPIKALPQMLDDRAKAITERLLNQGNDTEYINALAIPAAELEMLRVRYPVPA